MEEYDSTYHTRVQNIGRRPRKSNLADVSSRDIDRAVIALKEDKQVLLFVGSVVCYLFIGNKDERKDMKCWSKGIVEEGVANDCNETVNHLPAWVEDKLENTVFYSKYLHPVNMLDLCPVYVIMYSDKAGFDFPEYLKLDLLAAIVERDYDTTTQQWK